VDSISSWSRETTTLTDEVSSLESGVELLRKGSQKAVGGMKRLMRSVRSNRSSDGSASQLEAVSLEIESSSGGENVTLNPAVSEPLAESKTANTSSRARHWPRPIEDSSAPIRANMNMNSITNTSVQVIRPSPRLDVETATIVTTWPGVASPVVGDRERKVEELARADERLARVRDGRGYINFNLI
jgi:hypothetical protein